MPLHKDIDWSVSPSWSDPVPYCATRFIDVNEDDNWMDYTRPPCLIFHDHINTLRDKDGANVIQLQVNSRVG